MTLALTAIDSAIQNRAPSATALCQRQNCTAIATYIDRSYMGFLNIKGKLMI